MLLQLHHVMVSNWKLENNVHRYVEGNKVV
jgi:hypothetical protein